MLLHQVQAFQMPPVSEKEEPDHFTQMQEVTTTLPATKKRFMVVFAAKANLTFADPSEDAVSRRQDMISLLQETAVSSQQAIRPLLDNLQTAGHISKIQPFWIINALSVTGDAEAIAQLAKHPAISEVREEAHFHLDQSSFFETISNPVTVNAPQNSLTITTGAWGVSRIRAPYAWHGLGINGEGITVAIMDSGVDWLHPDLHANYRGNLGNGYYDHAGNWFNALDPTITEPQDWLWHGTHVAGTAVGQNGLGVAPGAQWIAVAIADENGSIPESAIHAGFEWLLAPDGDPSLAPDIVNCSWSSSDPYWTMLTDDINALQTAGIIPVFSAGNTGSLPGTVGAPASYENTLAVGASDEDEDVAWFSSRGPSPLTDLPKPLISAPGVRILSAYPGGQYAYANGTSMAAPHVSGAVALMLSANQGMTEAEVWQRLAETAVPMVPTHPNNDSGWGRLDAYAALLPAANTGIIQGSILQNGQPIAGAAITVTNSSGYAFRFESDANGRYQISLLPGFHTLTITAFGFNSLENIAVTLEANKTLNRDFLMAALPNGLIHGVIVEQGTNIPLPAEIHVEGTPVTAVANSLGHYAIRLPIGTYHLIVEHNGHRLTSSTIQVTVGGPNTKDFQLAPAPTILLVEAGAWYFNSHIEAYQDALAAGNYYADLLTIKDPFRDTPLTSTVFSPYDTIIWADPQRAPGILGADYALSQYLLAGGNLLVSGQNIAFYDGSNIFPAYWWYNLLQARYLDKWILDIPPPIQGISETIFADLNISLAGQESSAPQQPDRTKPSNYSLAVPVLEYANGEAAGLQAGGCQNYRIIYLGFGLEGVTDASTRSELISRSIDYFQTPRQTRGVFWKNAPTYDLTVPGQDNVYELTLQNQSEVLTDSFTITTQSEQWPSSLLTRTVEIGPCRLAKTVLTVSVPAEAPKGMTHTVQVTAVSDTNAAISDTFTVQQRIPQNILLVDDDRWYEYEQKYQSVLDSLNVAYDVWDTGGTTTTAGRGSPSLSLLRQYDIVLWFTGYDWYQPVTAQERTDLETYLREGGRLFLSSQDYLYYNSNASLTRNFFGVYDYQESITPTAIYAGQTYPLSDPLGGPYHLDFGAAKNNGDGMIPAPNSQAIAWNEYGTAAALATKGANWRTIFWSLPFEFLTDTVRTEAIHGMLGWLSNLGDSTITANSRQEQPGELLTYTLNINTLDYTPSAHVTMTNQLPEGLTVLTSSLPPDVAYDAQSGTLTWNGVLAGGENRQIRYQAVIDAQLPDGTRLENRVTLRYDQHPLQFDRVATVWVNTPDLSASQVEAQVSTPLPYQFIWYTMTLQNASMVPAENITAVLHIPSSLQPLNVTLQASAGTAVLQENKLVWRGNIAGQERITVSILSWRQADPRQAWVMATAMIDDPAAGSLVRTAVSYLPPYTQHMPLIFKQP